jgi:hypothetical protein
LHPRDLASFTDEVYAPKRRTAFTAHIKQFNGLANISIFHLSCMSNVLMWVSLGISNGAKSHSDDFRTITT